MLGHLISGTHLDETGAAAASALSGSTPGAVPAVILAGERLAEVPGALTAAARLAQATGAQLAWIPRRAGERGAIEAGALPGLLPVGRPVTDPRARAEVARAWAVAPDSLPSAPGRSTAQMLAAAAAGEIGALVVAGVDPDDLPDPAAALGALEAAPFVVSLELRASAVTDRADVVLPVAAVAEKAGTFVNWEGRGGSFGAALSVPGAGPISRSSGTSPMRWTCISGCPTSRRLAVSSPRSAAGTARALRSRWAAPGVRAEPGPLARGEAVLATWKQLLDAGRMQDGEPFLAGTARPPVAMMSAATAAEASTADGDKVTVATAAGAVTVPVRVTDMPDQVVWLPANSAGCAARRELAAGHGSRVMIRTTAPGSAE